MRYFRYLIWLIIIVLVIIFTIMNAHLVEIDYYFGKVQIFLPLIIFLGLLAGAILGYLAAIPKIWRMHQKNRHLKNINLNK